MKIAIVMGSTSDWNVMKGSVEILETFGIEHEVKVLSAHRTPHQLEEWVSQLRQRDFGVVIAGAGGAAHLAGVVAAFTTLPVIGVPILGHAFNGLDSLLSMVQMPSGIPVAVVAVNGAKNSALLALEILAVKDHDLQLKLEEFRKKQADAVLSSSLE
ncbi:MAG: 5-(carboxyamino)imidazole ribonucleotide mutase [Muribaculaceae bacterium]|nr:5-(carboxyamino)imidazole ribonucleotide mutase [Muribaculaceae bacterium]